MPNSVVEVDTSRLDRILRNLEGNIEEALSAVGFSVEGKAKNNAPVDTGALRNSIYTRAYSRDGESMARAMVRAANPQAEITPLPAPESRNVVHVGPSVNYALYVEFGTNRMGARPFLSQAVRDVTDEMAAAMGDAVTDGRE